MKPHTSLNAFTTILIALVMLCVPSLALAGKAKVVQLKGEGTVMENPPVEEALCYEIELFDPRKGKLIGTGIDCLADITPVGDSFLIDRTTIFNFKRGTIWANGLTTVAPIVGGSPDVTHVVGDIPDENANSIIVGTGKYEDTEGRVRLSGAVNLTNFPESIVIDCLFVLDLEM